VVPLAVTPVAALGGFYHCRGGRFVFLFFNVYNPKECQSFMRTLHSLGVDSRSTFRTFASAHTAEEVEQYIGYFATMVRTTLEWRQLRPETSANPFRMSRLAPSLPLPLPPLGKLPLSGVKVLDFSRVVAGPYSARLLADMGASVLQVSNPTGVQVGLVDMYASAGKRSTFLDLTVENDLNCAQHLLSEADVVITNFPLLEQANQIGIGPSSVSRRRPFVHLNVSAYPTDSQWAGRKGYAPMAAAASGLFHAAVGTEGLMKASESTDSTLWPCDGYPEDYFGGMLGCVGVLAALRKRAEHGGPALSPAIIVCSLPRFVNHSFRESFHFL